MTTGIFGISLSGLQAAQAGMRVTAQNIANANTPGYARSEVNLTAVVVGGSSGGVRIEGIERAADRFLSQSFFQAEGVRASSLARSDLLNRAQAVFGDPTSDTSLFASLDRVWAAFTEATVDPVSPLRRTEVIDTIDRMLSEVQRASAGVQDLIAEADQRVGESVSRINSLLEPISELNTQIRLSMRTGADATGAQNAQGVLIDELSTLLDIRVDMLTDGSVQIRTAGGALLVGTGAARLSHVPNGTDYGYHNPVMIALPDGTDTDLQPLLRSGELKGLIDTRDRDLQGLAEALGGLGAALADTINEAHVGNTPLEAPKTLVGRQTGLLATDTLNFTGQSIIGLVDGDGVLRNRLTIDFDAGQIISEQPAATYAFANRIGIDGAAADVSFVERLNQALFASGGGAASFSQGALTVRGGGYGLVIQQDAADPSARAGRGFAHFFGLNDAVRASAPFFYEAGVSASDRHGLAAGGQITFRISSPDGKVINERTVTIAGALAGPTSSWSDLMTALNSGGTGIGEFAAASIDPATGRLSIASNEIYRVDVMADSTQRGDSLVSLSSLFGLSRQATASRPSRLLVREDLAADPSKLSLGRPDIRQPLGSAVVEQGDNRGATALLSMRDMPRTFAAAGALPMQTTGIGLYASRLGGEAGRLAGQADRELRAAESLSSAAADRRGTTEGVSIDDELVKLTQYQQSYAASARVIQAASEMLDILLRLGA